MIRYLSKILLLLCYTSMILVYNTIYLVLPGVYMIRAYTDTSMWRVGCDVLVWLLCVVALRAASCELRAASLENSPRTLHSTRLWR